MASARLDLTLVGHDLASNVIQGVREQFQSLGTTIKDVEEQGAFGFGPLTDAMNGLLLGSALASGNLMAMALSLIFVRDVMNPLFLLMTAITAAGALGLGAVKAAAQIQTYRTQLQAILPDANQAAAALAYAQQFISQTPFHLDETIQSIITLHDVGMSAVGVLNDLGNAAIAEGQKLDSTTKDFTSAIEGSYSALKKYGIKVIQDQNDLYFQYVDKAGHYIEDAIAKGNPNAVRDEVLKIFKDKFAGAIDEANNTLQGKWAKLVNNAQNFMANVGQALIPIASFIVDQLNGIFTFLNGLLNQVAKSRVFSDLSNAFHDLVAALQPILPALQEIARILLALPLFVFVGLIRVLTVLVQAAANELQNLAGTLQLVGSIMKTLINPIAMLWNYLLKLNPDQLVDKFKEFLFNLPGIISGFLQNLLKIISDNWLTWYNGLKQAFSTAWAAFKNFLAGAALTVKLLLTPVFDFLTGMLHLSDEILSHIWDDLVPQIVKYFLTHPIDLANLAVVITGLQLGGIKGAIFAEAAWLIVSQIVNEIQKRGPDAAIALGLVFGAIVLLSVTVLRGQPWLALAAAALAALFADNLVTAFQNDKAGFTGDVLGTLVEVIVESVILALPVHPLIKAAMLLAAAMLSAKFREQMKQSITQGNWADFSGILAAVIALAIVTTMGAPVIIIAAAALGGEIIGLIAQGIINHDPTPISIGVGGVIGAGIGAVIAGPPGAIIGGIIGLVVGWLFANFIDQMQKGNDQPIGAAIGGTILGAIGFIVGGPVGALLLGAIGMVVGGLVGRIVSAFNDGTAEQAIATAIYNIINIIDPLIESIGKIGEKLHVIQPGWQTDWDNIRSAAVGAMMLADQHVKEHSQQMADSLKTNSNKMSSDFNGSVTTMVSNAKKQLDDLSKSTDTSMSDMKQSIDTNSQGITSSWQTMIDNLHNTNYNAWQQIVQDTTDGTHVLSDQFTQTQNGSVDGFDQSIQQLQQQVSQQLADMKTNSQQSMAAMQTDMTQQGQTMQTNMDTNTKGITQSFTTMRDQVKPVLDTQMPQAMEAFRSAVVTKSADIKNAVTDMSNMLKQKMQEAADAVKQQTDKIKGYLAGIPHDTYTYHHVVTVYESQGSPSGGGGGSLPARAGGGPVAAGQAYIVGENGKEVFVPNQDGTIIPNGGLTPTPVGVGGSGGNTIIVNIDRPAVFDRQMLRDLTNEVSAEIAAKLKLDRRAIGVTF